MWDLICYLFGRKYYKHMYTGDYIIMSFLSTKKEPDKSIHTSAMCQTIYDYKSPRANSVYAPLKPMWEYSVKEITRKQYYDEL